LGVCSVGDDNSTDGGTMSDTTIPHNHWAFIVTHTTGGKYLYVSKKPMTMAEVMDRQNKDTIKSISLVDVNMVVFFD